MMKVIDYKLFINNNEIRDVVNELNINDKSKRRQIKNEDDEDDASISNEEIIDFRAISEPYGALYGLDLQHTKNQILKEPNQIQRTTSHRD